MERSSVTVVRLDTHSGTSEIVRLFMFPQDDSGSNAESPLFYAKIGNDVVVIKESSHRLLVGNWRTGQARVIQNVSTSWL